MVVALGPREKSDESSELDFLWSFLSPPSCCMDSDESEEDIWPVRLAGVVTNSILFCWLFTAEKVIFLKKTPHNQDLHRLS